jgi:hypothetical protein
MVVVVMGVVEVVVEVVVSVIMRAANITHHAHTLIATLDHSTGGGKREHECVCGVCVNVFICVCVCVCVCVCALLHRRVFCLKDWLYPHR